MSEIQKSVGSVPTRMRWPRRIVVVLVVCVMLLVCAYFVVTSAPFFKGFILPRLSRTLGADLTVAEASINPFRRVVLRGLKLQTRGSEPLFTAREVRAEYSLLDLIGGKITVEELTVDSPRFVVVRNPDGTSNLDPIKVALAKAPRAAKVRKPTRPTQLDIKKVALNGVVVQLAVWRGDWTTNMVVLTNFTLAITGVKNGCSGKLDLSTQLNIIHNSTNAVTPDSLTGKLLGQFEFGLQTNARLASLFGTLQFETGTGTGALDQFGLMRGQVNCEITPTEIREVCVRLSKSGTTVGQVRLTGPFEIEKLGGEFAIEILGLNRQILNIAGAAAGLDFGTTTINSTNRVRVAQGVTAVSVAGYLHAQPLTVTHAGLGTPTLQLLATYDLSIDRAAGLIKFGELTITGKNNGRILLEARLTQPMTIAYRLGAGSAPDSAFEFRLVNLQLADWQAFIGQSAQAGKVNLHAKVTSEQAGKLLGVELTANADGLQVALGTNRISGLAVSVETRGRLKELKQLTANQLLAKVALRSHDILTVTGTGHFDFAESLCNAQVKATGLIPAIVPLLGASGATVSEGTFALEMRYSQKAQAQQFAGTVQLDSIIGRFGQSTVNELGATTEFDIGHQADQIDVKTVKCTLFHADEPCGTVQLTGKYNLKRRNGDAALQLTGLTERVLAPVLGSMLKDTKLLSVTLNCNASAKLESAGSGAANVDLQVTNLVVSDPQGRPGTKPLEVKLLVDGLIRTQVVELRQCKLALSPTTRAKNQLGITGTIDISRPNAINGRAKVTAETLDLTPYYDTLIGERSQRQPTLETNLPPQQKEPEPVKLPIGEFATKLTVGQFYLRDVAITDLQCSAQIRNGRILLDPIRLTLAGGPVNAKVDLDLGVPGWRYEVNLSATNVQIGPLASSFSPDYRNRATGILFANVNVKGAGITGTTLRRALTGNAALTLTNANVQLVGQKARQLITPIALVLGLDELAQASVTGVNAQVELGNGKITLTHCEVSSDAFVGRTAGEIEIRDVLAESQFNDWPITVALRSTLAQKAKLITPAEQPNAVYATLPVFAKLSGTVAKPVVKADKLVIAGLVAKSAGAIPGAVGGKAGTILQGVGDLLTGQVPGLTGGITNQPATNVTPVKPVLPVNPLDIFRKR